MLWVFVGLIDLAFLTWQDIRKRGWVDDRLNFSMMGATLMLLEDYPKSVVYLLIVLVVLALLSAFIIKFKLLGDADYKSIAWIMWGLSYINSSYLVGFFIATAFFTVVQALTARVLFKKAVRVPYYPVLFLSFLTTCLFYGLF